MAQRKRKRTKIEKIHRKFLARRARYIKWHDEGMTYLAIAKKEGISKQRVWQVVCNIKPNDDVEKYR